MQVLKRSAAGASAAGRSLAPARIASVSRSGVLFRSLPTASVTIAPALSFSTVLPRYVCLAATAEEPTAEDLANSSSIFISNLSWGVDNGALNDHLESSIGGVQRVNVMMRDGRSRGMAIADFDSPAAAQAAVQKLHETELDGRTINVRIATPRAERPPREPRAYGADRGYGSDRPPRREYERREPREPRGDRPQRDPDTQLYVGNLAWSTTWQEVRDAFSEAGHAVAFANVKTTPDGRSRGFAIVAFEDAAAAERAADEMNQAELGGRRMNVRRFTTERPAAAE